MPMSSVMPLPLPKSLCLTFLPFLRTVNNPLLFFVSEVFFILHPLTAPAFFSSQAKKSSACQLDLRDRHCSLLIANIAYILIFSSQKKDFPVDLRSMASAELGERKMAKRRRGDGLQPGDHPLAIFHRPFGAFLRNRDWSHTSTGGRRNPAGRSIPWSGKNPLRFEHQRRCCGNSSHNILIVTSELKTCGGTLARTRPQEFSTTGLADCDMFT